MPYLRLVLPCIALLIMIAIACTPEYEKVTISIPIGLAIGFMVTRWYVALPERQVRSWWRLWSHEPRCAYGLPLSFTLVLALVPALVRGGFAAPNCHDEFSYLLAADTYLQGRWANPTPVGWEHFESVHINVVPAYCSKYQPGMGLVLAAGQLLGHAYLGMLLVFALASLCSTWMLRIWLPASWAMMGSLLMACMLTVNWGDGYYAGGPLAVAAGSVLVRFMKVVQQQALGQVDAVVLSICLVALFWTRPFEGALTALLLGVPILILAFRRQGWKLVVLLPAGLLVLVLAAGMQIQLNYACTGSYTRLPYVEHEDQYGLTPLFLFQPPKTPPVYRHAELKRFQEGMCTWYDMQHGPQAWRALLFKLGTGWNCFFSLLWLVPLAVLPELWRRRWVAYLLLCWVLLILVLLFGTTWFLHHYAAPLVGAWAVVVVMSCRVVSRFHYRRLTVGRFMVVLLLTTTAVQAIIERNLLSYYDRESWSSLRQQRERDLERDGSHLVFVVYGPKHDLGQEWVYNGASISDQRVIWARSMGAETDGKLMNLYPERRYWVIQADSTRKPVAGELKPYPEPSSGSR